MLFIRVPVFIFFIFCILAGVVWMGISAYQLFIIRGEKAAAEVFFYVALCTTLITIAFILTIVLYSRIKQNMIKRITKLARVDGVLAVQRFSGLGSFGAQLTILFQELLDLSEKRAQRIVYLGNAIHSLLGFVDKAVLLVDTTGSIQYVSDELLKIMDMEGKNITGLHIEDIYPELSIAEVAKELERNFTTRHEIKLEKVTLTFSPVFAKENTLAGMCAFVKRNTILTASGDAVKGFYENIADKTSRFFKRDRKKDRKEKNGEDANAEELTAIENDDTEKTEISTEKTEKTEKAEIDTEKTETEENDK